MVCFISCSIIHDTKLSTLQNNELSNKINAIYFQIPQQNLTSVSQLDANVVRRMIVVGSLGALEEYAELKGAR